MLRITEIPHDGGTVQLIDDVCQYDWRNTFTVIVGKNGVGKSRLLAEIAKACTRESQPQRPFNRMLPDLSPVVIAASTSPFDKFPSPPRRHGKTERNYRYVGMRGEGLYGASSAVSLLSSAARGLLAKLGEQRPSVNLLAVLNSLSFSPKFRFVLKPQYQRFEDVARAERRTRHAGLEMFKLGGRSYVMDVKLRRLLDTIPEGELAEVIRAMESVPEKPGVASSVVLDVDFGTQSAHLLDRPMPPKLLHAFLKLFETGLYRLTDIEVEKQYFGPLSLRRASSGEQCMLVLMLGIAGHIQDGSVILVDEPEISLHPEWQEQFMEILQGTFGHYSSCQFIVATHSPQITARLGGSNSFIYSLTRRKLYSASQFSQRSADFQLAELFDAPGLMNEYISRVCFNLIAQLRSSPQMTVEMRHDMRWLIGMREKLRTDLKLRGLIDSVKELYDTHGHD